MKNQIHSKVQYHTVEDEYHGQRVDNFLMRLLKGVPKGQIYRILRRGEVRVNKGRIKAHYRLQAGDQLRIPPLQLSVATPTTANQRSCDWLLSRILYEDERIIIINKPAGMAVHGGSGISLGVIEIMRQARSDLHYLELVHRLDRETSGCLILAKKRSALRQLHELLRNGEIQKRYLAIVKGPWQAGERRVDKPLDKNVLRSGERIVRVNEDGKTAISIFKPMSVRSKASLMEVDILTGRTHQIRVHAAYCQHPIAGDEKYGDELFNREMVSRGCNRLFLHARSLSFTLLTPTKDIAINAPLDPEWDKCLAKLKLDT